MTLYRYRAASSTGGIVTGQVASDSTESGYLALGAQGLMAIEMVPVSEGRRRSCSPGNAALIFRSMASLVGVGVPLERAIGLTESMLDEPAIRSGLGESRLRLRQGSSLSEALGAVPGLVSPAVLGVIRAGEETGRLGNALKLVADQLERERETAGRLRQALAYPAILATTGTLSIALITTIVLPRFAQLLADAGGTLPPLARGLLWINSLSAGFWGVVLLGIALMAGGVFRWTRTPAGRLTWSGMLLKAPFIGPVRHHLATSRATRSLSTGLSAGLPLLRALATATDAAADEAIRQRLQAVSDRVAQGEPLAKALHREQAVVPVASQMLAVGEASGQLGPMAERASDYAAAEAERRLAVVTRLMEPGLILLFGGLLALVAGALLQTVYGLRPAL